MNNDYNTDGQSTEDNTPALQEGETSPCDSDDCQSDDARFNDSEELDCSDSYWTSTNSPEPPARWNPVDIDAGQGNAHKPFEDSNVTGMGVIGKTRFPLKNDEIPVFQSARRYIIISQVASAVSLVLGGVFLSSIALICAIAGCGKLSRLASSRPGDPEAQRALKRSGWTAIAITVVVLALNIFALIYLYPMFADSLQNAGFGNLAGSTSAGTGSVNTTWG